MDAAAPLIVASIVIALMGLLGVMCRRWLLGRAELGDDDIAVLREELLECVKDVSHELGTHVALAGFWKGAAIRSGDRFRVVKPLIDAGVLRLPMQGDTTSRVVRSIMNYPFLDGYETVILNSRDWHRMATGASASTIISGTNIDYHPTTNNLDVSGTGHVVAGNAQAGASASARARGIRGSIGPDLDALSTLVDALRADAAQLPKEDAARAEDLAEDLDHELSRDEPDEGRLGRLVKRAASLASGVSAGMAATAEAVKVLQDWTT